MPFLPILDEIESRFDLSRTVEFMSHNWHHSLYASALYVLLVHSGRTWMHRKKPYDLRRALVMWNTGIAVFSMIGFAAIISNMIRSLSSNGLTHTVCESDAIVLPELAVWGHLFVLSKPFELLDTFFIVLRKSPLSFLHWYHHCTVFIYAFYILSNPVAILHWFGVMNYFVHSIMYSYYACKAMGWRIPSKISLLITTLQLAQMFWGIYLNVLAFIQLKRGVKCVYTEKVFYISMGLYVSYALLFLKFFYQRYGRKQNKH